MKKVLILAGAGFVILAINISTVRADTRYETGMFVGQAALIEADTKVFSTANFDTKPITTLKRGTIVTILSMKNPEKKYHWVLVGFDSKAGWIHVTPTVHSQK